MENWGSEEMQDKREGAPDQEGEAPGGAKARKEASDGRDLYLNIRVLVLMMTAFVLLFTFVARIIVVSGASMENTLHGGDLMLVWSLGYAPRQGDVVVVTQESYQEDSIVKRVIALEGQTVDIDYYTGTVYVDGKPLKEDYIKEEMLVPSYGEGVNHVTVPEGCIFVMGDNRNHSADSRYSPLGQVERREVLGKVLFMLLPGRGSNNGYADCERRDFSRIGIVS